MQCKVRTPARLLVGHAGPRLTTSAMLAFRADHAAARDAVYSDVPNTFLTTRGLPVLQTLCRSKEEFLLRPDLGRIPDDESKAFLQHSARHGAAVQLYLSDGLSGRALTSNHDNLVPAILDGLAAAKLDAGTLFYVRYGRVAVQDWVSELTGSAVCIVLLGERPGLGGGQSLSAYLTYHGTVGMAESRRTVVSNIHPDGVPAVEAGAQIAYIAQKMLEQRCSGLGLEF